MRKLSNFEKKILIIFLVGLLIRLLFMPFTCHADLITGYSESLLKMRGSQLGRDLLLINYVQMLNLKINSRLIPTDTFNTTRPYDKNGTFLHDVQTQIWLQFLEKPFLYRTLFLLKLPYLFFDILCAVLILLIFKVRDEILKAFSFWMFNPALIFSSYIFGRPEIITIFLVLLFFFFLKRDKHIIATLVLIIAVFTRWYPILIAPFYFTFLLSKKRMGKVLFLAFILSLLILPLILFNHPSISHPFIHTLSFVEITLRRFVLNLSWNIAGITFYPIIFFYLILFLLFLNYKSKDFNSLVVFSLSSLLLYFALGYFHPQFYAWLTPFFVLLIKNNKLIKYYYVHFLLFLPLTFHWGKDLFARLFAPLNPLFFMNYPSPSELINHYFTYSIFEGIMRSLFSAFTIWIIFSLLLWVFKDKIEKGVFKEHESRN